MKLFFRKQTSAKVLSEFYCGVGKIDEFIHGNLEFFLDDDMYSFYTVHFETGELVAMFIFSCGKITRRKGEKMEIEETGSPHTAFDDGELTDLIQYDTLELEYLAVQEEYRDNKKDRIGSQIIEELAARARNEGKYFITVGAYHESGYSAIGFYERNQFCAVEEYDGDKDTLRMYKYIGMK